MKYTKIDVIFDRDHGPSHLGWYTRTTDADGQQEDQPVNEDWWEDALVPEATIRTWAVAYFSDPNGMTDDQLDDLRARIEVRR